jgi:hypothetical protein
MKLKLIKKIEKNDPSQLELSPKNKIEINYEF